jgi:hypothetical protein
MAEFTPRPPEIKVYLKDGEGKIDTKDREREFGLWLGENLTKNGTQYLNGKHKDQGLVAFVNDGKKIVDTDEGDKTEEADW